MGAGREAGRQSARPKAVDHQGKAASLGPKARPHDVTLGERGGIVAAIRQNRIGTGAPMQQYDGGRGARPARGRWEQITDQLGVTVEARERNRFRSWRGLRVAENGGNRQRQHMGRDTGHDNPPVHEPSADDAEK
jgi:hypothetical protein